MTVEKILLVICAKKIFGTLRVEMSPIPNFFYNPSTDFFENLYSAETFSFI